MCVVGALLLNDYGKKKHQHRKFPFTVHRRVGTFIFSGEASFACTGRTSMLLDTQLFALCILQLNVLLKRKTSAITSERDRRMMGKFLFPPFVLTDFGLTAYYMPLQMNYFLCRRQANLATYSATIINPRYCVYRNCTILDMFGLYYKYKTSILRSRNDRNSR